MLASLSTKLATLSMVILITTLAFTSSAYAAPVPASAADIIHIDERPLPFVNTIPSRRADTPAKPEAENYFHRTWHYRRDVEDKAEAVETEAEAAAPSLAKPEGEDYFHRTWHYRR